MLPVYRSIMSPFRVAYVLLIAVVIALRLLCAGAAVSASDQMKMPDSADATGAGRAQLGAAEADSAVLTTGRSVATPRSRVNGSANQPERKIPKGVGALGFARR